ncbi:MAG: MATE family efflux transporter [Clostridiales bacterium]|nr:MATE family efflux transporter [Clostridiales bacterium]MCD8132250.1 MATE family efflux transporter [Clostridiales bacterium]MCD8132254.1 MATE family efflux transporter [Clostridiales bacterium]
MSENCAAANPLGTERIGKLIVMFSIPSIISLVVNAFYNIIDQIFIGQSVGYLGNGATNVVMPLTVIIIALALMVGDGSAAFLSLKLGQSDAESAAKGVGNGIVMTIAAGIILCILFQIFLRPLCLLFGATEDILPYALDYGRIISWGVLFAAIDSSLASIIRADGSPKYSMAGLLIGCATNIILDPVFIFICGWGVKGAATATILGEILNAVFYLAYLRKFKSIRMKKECFVLSGNVMKKVCSLGISSFIQQFAIVLIMAVTNNVLVIYGARSVYGSDIPLTTIGITMKVNQILIAAVMGMASGAQPIFGYNYGNQQVDRVKKTYRLVLTASTVILIIAFLIFQFKPMSIVRLFGSESDLYNEFAVKCFRIFLLACPLNGCQMVTSVFFQAIGKPKLATVLSLTRQVIFFIPAALLLPLALGVEGVLWTGAFADTLAFIVSVILIKRNWKKL